MADATAAHTYWEARYERACVEERGPASCGPCQLALNESRREVQLANQVYKIGKLPKAERVELKKAAKAIEACP